VSSVVLLWGVTTSRYLPTTSLFSKFKSPGPSTEDSTTHDTAYLCCPYRSAVLTCKGAEERLHCGAEVNSCSMSLVSHKFSYRAFNVHMQKWLLESPLSSPRRSRRPCCLGGLLGVDPPETRTHAGPRQQYSPRNCPLFKAEAFAVLMLHADPLSSRSWLGELFPNYWRINRIVSLLS